MMAARRGLETGPLATTAADAGRGRGRAPADQDGEFTFLLPAGRKQCFYPVRAGQRKP